MISNVIYIMLLLQLTGKNNIDGCLIWTYDRDTIRFICKIEGIMPVHLVNNRGKDVARCTFNESSFECSSFYYVKPIIRGDLVTFHINRNLKIDLNGKWSCLQQNNTFIAEVSTSGADLTKSTTVNLSGKIIENGDVQRFLLTCSSCRIPEGKHVEFLVNNSSEEVITFHNETGKCTSLHGDCTSNKCNCSSSGNTFALFLSFKKQMTTNMNFSCEMKFEDNATSVVFSKVPTLSFNGKEFKYRGTRTVIKTLTDVHYRSKATEKNTVGKWIAGISATVVFAIILTVVIYTYYKRRRFKKEKKSAENIPFIESHLGKMTDTITEAETRFTDKKSTIEISQRTHDEAQRIMPDLIDSFLKTLSVLKSSIYEIEPCLKRPNEPQTTFTSEEKTVMEIGRIKKPSCFKKCRGEET